MSSGAGSSSSTSSSSSLPIVAVVGTTAAATVVAVAVAFLYGMRRKKKNSLKRTFSFTSANLAIRGGFPKTANVPEPVIQAVLLFDDRPPPTDQAMIELVIQPILTFHRCNSVPVPEEQSTRPLENGGKVDMKKLVRRIQIDSEGEDEVFEIVMKEGDLPLRDRRVDGEELPWFEFLVIENKAKDGTSAVVWRMHHAIGDGISMVSIVQQICTHVDGSPITGSLLPVRMGSKFERGSKTWYERWWDIIIAASIQLGVPTSPFDDPSPFKNPPGPQLTQHSRQRSLVRFQTAPLSFLKSLKDAAKVSLNDIVYACVSQAIHDYIADQQGGEEILQEKGTELKCRSLMPVAFPRPQEIMEDRDQALRNKWVFLSCDLAVGCTDILQRLQQVHKTMSALKQSPIAPVAWALQETIPPLLPMSINDQVVLDTFQRHSLIHSNVPGPSFPCCIAGVECSGVQMVFNNFLPQTGFLSYRGWMFGSIVLDSTAISNAESLSIYYSRAMVEMASQLSVDVPKDIVMHAEQDALKR